MRSRRERRIVAVLVATLAVALFPSIEVAIAGGLLIVLVAFVLTTKALRRDWANLPLSLRLTHIGVGVIVAGTMVRILESVLSGGVLAVPSWADAIAVPGLIAVTASLVLAAHARAATSRINDFVDALVVSLVIVSAIAAIGWPYLTNGAIPWQERATNGGALVLDFVFLTMTVLLVYGPGSRSNAAVWLGLAAAGSVLFDTLLFVGIALDAPWRDEPTRILALAFVAYAIGVTDASYRVFASPGTRPQQYRWALYPVALIGTAAIAAISGLWWLTGSFVAIVMLTAVRIGTAGKTARRLASIVEAQAGLAAELSKADSAGGAIEAARKASAKLVDDRPIVIAVADVDADADADVDVGADGAGETPATASRASRLIRSTRERVTIDAGGDLPPYLIVALTQVANVLEPAITAIEDRARRLQHEAEAEAERAWQELTVGSHEVVLLAVDGRVVKASPNAKRDLGFDPHTRGVEQISTLSHANVDTELAFANPYQPEQWVKVTSFRQPDNSVIFTIRDVTAEHQAARTDPITGLANLADLNRQDDLAVGESLTVFFFHDLDRAAERPEGTDELARSIVECLEGLIRAGEDRLWRGEGASLIMRSPAAPSCSSKLEWVEERRVELTKAIDPLTPVRSLVTAGTVVATEPVSAPGALLRAERAMKHGRLHDPAATTHYSVELRDSIDRTWRIENRLVSALQDSDPSVHGFRVEYQPIVDAKTRFATTAEALVRWTHPELGPIFPDEFIPLAEDLDLVDRIDRHVLSVALADLNHLRRFHPDFKVHVNVSPTGLRPANLTALTDQLRRSSLTNHVVVEITETGMGDQDLTELAQACNKIAETGATLSIDDFGDGESNFARIGELPVAEVKLAKHFAEFADIVVVESVVGSLHNLGNNVVAENIETEDQAEKLLVSGVDEFQGYLFSRPKPIDDLLEWLVGQTSRPPISDGTTLGPLCESDRRAEHASCAGWWANEQSGSATCACPCHAKAQSWPGWQSFDLDLSH